MVYTDQRQYVDPVSWSGIHDTRGNFGLCPGLFVLEWWQSSGSRQTEDVVQSVYRRAEKHTAAWQLIQNFAGLFLVALHDFGTVSRST